MGAIFAVSLARVSDVGELPGERVALVAGAGEPIWRVGESIAGGVPHARASVRPVQSEYIHRDSGQSKPGESKLGESKLGESEPGESEPGQSEGDATTQGEPRAVTLLVGAEREGLPDELLAACERVAHIPIASESLNAAMAATVALYEMTRPSTRVPAS